MVKISKLPGIVNTVSYLGYYNKKFFSVGDLGLGSRDFNSDGQLIRRDKLCAEIIDGWGLELADVYINELFYQVRPEIHILRMRYYLTWFTKLDAW